MQQLDGTLTPIVGEDPTGGRMADPVLNEEEEDKHGELGEPGDPKAVMDKITSNYAKDTEFVAPPLAPEALKGFVNPQLTTQVVGLILALCLATLIYSGLQR
jgi:hypothetical protein